MENTIKSFGRYLKETLGLSVFPTKWEGTDQMPFLLRDFYDFFQVDILKTHCVLMVEHEQGEQTPASVKKHTIMVHEKSKGEVIYLCNAMSTYNRKRLLEQKVPFVVPGNQMYLPMFGVDLREYFRKIRVKGMKLSPATQVVLLYELLRVKENVYTPSGFANHLGYTVMTMTRAFNELELAGLAEVETGKERILHFTKRGRNLWGKALEYLKSPVRKKVWIKKPHKEWPGIQAGFTALAHYSMLAAPRIPAYAISQEDWKVLKQHDAVIQLPVAEPDAYEVEIWRYTPRLFEKNRRVDCLSLYLSMQKNTDERVEAALEEMLGAMEW
jgi:DNA-binding MarR family transcriptional regulator